MLSVSLWTIIIDDRQRPRSRCFKVTAPKTADVQDLAEAILKNDPKIGDPSVGGLVVWQLQDPPLASDVDGPGGTNKLTDCLYFSGLMSQDSAAPLPLTAPLSGYDFFGPSRLHIVLQIPSEVNSDVKNRALVDFTDASRGATRPEEQLEPSGAESRTAPPSLTAALTARRYTVIRPMVWRGGWSGDHPTCQPLTAYLVRRGIQQPVAKHAPSDSPEKSILQYLHALNSPYIIALHATLPSPTGDWLILTRCWSIPSGLLSTKLIGHVVDLSIALMNGISFLHDAGVAHRDLKLQNLVYTDELRLQIIDFDSTIRVSGEDDSIQGYVGTEGWTAPEVGHFGGSAHPYSPIRADRWACGHLLAMLACFITDPEGAAAKAALQRFAGELQNVNPLLRPPINLLVIDS